MANQIDLFSHPEENGSADGLREQKMKRTTQVQNNLTLLS